MKSSLVLCLTVVLVSACGKSDSEKFADSFCGEFVKCCAQASLPSNGNLCHLAMSSGSYSSQAADACLAEMRSEVAAGTFCTNLGSPACDSTSSTTGTKKPGDVCSFDSDCAPSSDGKVVCASLYVNSASINKCQVQIRGKAGDTPCVRTQDGAQFASYAPSDATDLAPQGYVCDVADGIQCKSGTCVALIAVGVTCSSTSDCVRSAYCDYTKSLCASQVATGSTCTGSDSSECVGGDYCDSTTKLCAVKGANGAACTTASMCQSSNCPSGTCQSNGLDTLGLAILCGS